MERFCDRADPVCLDSKRFCIKTTIYRERIHDYQEQANYYEARAMAKMALANEIKHKQIFRFNAGTVSRNYLKLTVELNDKKTYQFSVPTRFANFKSSFGCILDCK